MWRKRKFCGGVSTYRADGIMMEEEEVGRYIGGGWVMGIGR
jgi:hypothetical protein